MRELPPRNGLRGPKDGQLDEQIALIVKMSPCLSWYYLRPRKDSNLRTRFRKPTLYPLSYGSGTSARWSSGRTSRILGPSHPVPRGATNSVWDDRGVLDEGASECAAAQATAMYSPATMRSPMCRCRSSSTHRNSPSWIDALVGRPFKVMSCSGSGTNVSAANATTTLPPVSA